MTETIAAPTDPQVHVWFVVDCANDCDSFEEGNPAGKDEASALERALSDDWGMTRLPDGQLYCQHCTEQAAAEAACAAGGHQWGGWFSVLNPFNREYRQCDRCSEHEQREVES